MTLAGYATSRDNNFNLIRICAAMAVLVSHSYALSLGSGDAEPLRHSLATTPGLLAVDIFFVASGFLVTASLIGRRSLLHFVAARVLRIFPALLVMLVLVVFVLGLLMTERAPSVYLLDRQIYVHLVRNALLVTGISYDLPGVFTTNPYPSAVNGSLWTLPIELQMYGLLAGLWLVVCVLCRGSQALFKGSLLALAGAAALWHFGAHFLAPPKGHFGGLLYMFFTGAAFFVLRDRIALSRRIFWPALAALAFSTLHRDAFFVVYGLTIGYIVLFLAYVPAGPVRAYNRLGDYSYGVYIYAFPVQQAFAALVPGIGPWQMTAAAGVMTLLLAALSWHLLEEKALAMKDASIAMARGIVGRGKVALRANP